MTACDVMFECYEEISKLTVSERIKRYVLPYFPNFYEADFDDENPEFLEIIEFLRMVPFVG